MRYNHRFCIGSLSYIKENDKVVIVCTDSGIAGKLPKARWANDDNEYSAAALGYFCSVL